MTSAASMLTVAVAQPYTITGDVAANVARHADAVRRSGADLVVFPELSLTGYDLQAPALTLTAATFQPLIEACGASAARALVGAPIREGADEYIASLLVTGDGVSVAYRKAGPGGDETARFRPGDAPTAIEISGWRIALGICRDTGVREHVDGVAALRPDAYVAGLVHHATELAEQDRRGLDLVRACRAPVGFASFAGATGQGYRHTAGHSTVWDERGRVLARAGGTPGEVTAARLVLRR